MTIIAAAAPSAKIDFRLGKAMMKPYMTTAIPRIRYFMARSPVDDRLARNPVPRPSRIRHRI